MVFEIFSTRETTYNAVDSDKLFELLTERQKQLAGILPDLKKKFHHRGAKEEAYIYRGLEGQKNIFRDVLRVGQDSYFIGAKGGWFDPRLKQSRLDYFKSAAQKNIKFIQLFDFELKGYIPDFSPAKHEYRFLPKHASSDSTIHIFGDYVITYAGLGSAKPEDDITFFVMHSKRLVESYKAWFKFMWEKSAK